MKSFQYPQRHLLVSLLDSITVCKTSPSHNVWSHISKYLFKYHLPDQWFVKDEGYKHILWIIMPKRSNPTASALHQSTTKTWGELKRCIPHTLALNDPKKSYTLHPATDRMKGDVLSCLCTFLSPKSKFSLHKKIRDNNNQEQAKEKHGKVACRQKTLLQCVAGKYLWSCHGTRPQLRILFKQSLSEHAEGDEDTVLLWFPCGPPSQRHTLQTPPPLTAKNRRGVRAEFFPDPARALSGIWAKRKRYTKVQRGLSSNVKSCSLEKTWEWRLTSANKEKNYLCRQHFGVI